MTNVEIKNLIKRRRLQMLVHSCIYYELNETLISDNKWQAWADELADLIKRYPELNTHIDQFDQFFSDWTGDSGFNLPLLNPWVMSTAKRLLKQNNAQTVV